MFEIFMTSVSPMILLFSFMLIGYFCNKTKITPENTDIVLSKLETSFFVPALTLSTFMNNCSISSLVENSRSIIFCVILLALAVLIAFLIAGFFSKDAYTKNVYRYSIIFGNFGFLGYPVVQALFGDVGLYRYMVFLMPATVVVYTLGMGLLIPGNGRKKVFSRLLNPSFVAMIIGIAFGLLGVKTYLPDFVKNLLTQLSNCMGPLAMVLTGFTIGNYRFSSMLSNKKVYIATFLRLIALPLLYVVILKFMNAGSDIMAYTVFAFAAPFGLNTVIFPESYGGDAKPGAAMAMISHTLAVVTVPLMYAMVQAIV